MENAIELKDIYKDVVRNGNDVADIFEWIKTNTEIMSGNIQGYDRVIKELIDAHHDLADKHRAVIFGGLVLCGGLFVLSTKIKRQNVKIKALELRVESLERRRNLHVCSGDCHTEE